MEHPKNQGVCQNLSLPVDLNVIQDNGACSSQHDRRLLQHCKVRTTAKTQTQPYKRSMERTA